MPQVREKAVKSWTQLRKSITPIVPGEGERIPWTWYHRVSFVTNSTVQLTFFNATGVLTTTNMEAAGQIPAPMYFEVYHLGVWFDFQASNLPTAITDTTPALGAFTDTVNLSDGIVSLQVAQKIYHKTPIWMCPPGGGPQGDISFQGSGHATIGLVGQSATLGNPDLRNRNCFWGDIVIPHNQNFSVVLDWPAVVVLDNGTSDIIVALDGYLYRRVL